MHELVVGTTKPKLNEPLARTLEKSQTKRIHTSEQNKYTSEKKTNYRENLKEQVKVTGGMCLLESKDKHCNLFVEEKL